jgi:hypothetical protein
LLPRQRVAIKSMMTRVLEDMFLLKEGCLKAMKVDMKAL